MKGIQLNRPISYKYSSLRFFEKGEHHVTRTCHDDVLLLVYEGTLRFLEDGREYEVTAGHYHIQRHGSLQIGRLPSDCPKYLYVHFLAEWGEGSGVLSRCGEFDSSLMKELLEKMDRYAHGETTKIEQTAVFFEILSALYRRQLPPVKGSEIAEFLQAHYRERITLEMLSKRFHYGKNQIINVFKQSFSKTPMEYLNRIRIQKAMYELEVTSNSTESIAESCGFFNYSHFYRLFLRQNGVSPSQWRQKRRTAGE